MQIQMKALLDENTIDQIPYQDQELFIVLKVD